MHYTSFLNKILVLADTIKTTSFKMYQYFYLLVYYIKICLILEAKQNNRIRKLFMKITKINKANKNYLLRDY